MAVVNQKSSVVSAYDTTQPVVKIHAAQHQGKLRSSRCLQAVANGDSDTSTFRLHRLPSNAILHEWLIWTSANFTGGTDWDAGLYRESGVSNGAVIDKDCYADGQSLATAVSRLDLSRVTKTEAGAEQALWEDGGLSSDPREYFDLTLTANTIGTVGGNIESLVYYAIE